MTKNININSNIDKILIVDFGSQFTKLVAKNIRKLKTYSEIHSFKNVDEKFVRKFNPKGIILSGGPSSVYDKNSPKLDDVIYTLNIPILGICYGMQTMCLQQGGDVIPGNGNGEFGRTSIKIIKESKFLTKKWSENNRKSVWMSHGDKVSKLPKGFEVISLSNRNELAIIANEEKKQYGLQFHPELTHTEDGADLLRNFIEDICLCKLNWTMNSFKDEVLLNIKKQVGAKKVICALSGGVDSSVTAALLHKSIGDQLTCIFVDHGLLRLNEADNVIKMFKDNLNINIVHVNAKELFLNALKNIYDPEEKRKTIGKLFIKVFEEEAKKIKDVEFLAQGTLYPDVIESISFTHDNVTIKSHHNVGGLPKKMNLKLIEPLRELFKDEVRNLGYELGMPEIFIKRHPFPGPGLAIRIIGDITDEKCTILKKADDIFINEIKNAGLYDQIWQAFVVLLPVKSVGVMGDSRTYEYVCSLRAVTSIDGMSADVYNFESSFLTNIATKIINNVEGINRVVYDHTSKPPGTIEWE